MWVRILLRRLVQSLFVLAGVSLIVFSFIHLTPGDPVELMMGEASGVYDDEIAALRHEYGLDRPLPMQFLLYVGRVLRGDLGVSFTHQRPVIEVLILYLPATVELTLVAMVLALIIALPLGMASGIRPGGPLDSGSTALALIGVSLPGFLLGILLILFFGMTLEWLPISGRIGYSVDLKTVTGLYLIDSLIAGDFAALASVIRHLVLPATALGAWTMAVTLRMARTSMSEVWQQDYILFARAKGLSNRSIIVRHALKNALIPVVSVVGLQFGALLGGNMIIETVFGWPGLGRMTVDAIYARNYPLVQASVLLYAATYVIINFITDLVYIYLNPRIKSV